VARGSRFIPTWLIMPTILGGDSLGHGYSTSAVGVGRVETRTAISRRIRSKRHRVSMAGYNTMSSVRSLGGGDLQNLAERTTAVSP
jgi:hypothetical protein